MSPRSWLRPAAGIAGVATLLAFGCSGGSERNETGEEASAGAPVADRAAISDDPCALLTADDLREVSGVDPGPPVRREISSGSGIYLCSWPQAADTSRQIASLMVLPASGRVTFDQYLADVREGMGEDFDSDAYEEVDGVGEMAVWAYGSTLQAWSHGRMVQVQSGIGGEGLDREQSADLARRAIARL